MKQRLVFLYLFGVLGFVKAAPSGEDTFTSPAAAAILAKAAMDAYAGDPFSSRTIEITMTFLEAAAALDPQLTSAQEMLLKVAASAGANPNDYSRSVRDALRQYIDERANLAIVTGGVEYLLGRLQTRLEREMLLGRLIGTYGNKNPAVVSELSTHLALLEMERADTATAFQRLQYAYSLNPYNMLAFSKMAEISQDAVPQGLLTIQLRRTLEMNPLDVRAARAYADILRQVQLYESACQAYQYCADLYGYLNPGQQLPGELLLPWSLCALQSEKTASQCVVLAEQARTEGREDLMLEAAAGMALMRMGQTEKGRVRLETAGRKAAGQIRAGDESVKVLPEQLSWFYSFVLPDSEQALAWGHEAISRRPDSPQARVLFAYALAQNGQEELARQYLEQADENDPVALFTQAVFLLKENNREAALVPLKKIVQMGPETLVAWRAQEVLKVNGSEYLPAFSPAEILQHLKAEFGDEVTPKFLPLSKMVRVKLRMSGSEYPYGSEMPATVVIDNIGPRLLVIGPMGMLHGDIRIDAEVRGDLVQSFPSLVRFPLRPSLPIRPGQHAAVTVELMTGPLRRLLRTYPQASVEIDFVLRVDGTDSEEMSGQDLLLHPAPVRQTIRRRGIVLTYDFLIQRLSGLAKGKEGQKFRSAELFTGLLAEQQAALANRVGYRFVRAEPALLADAVRRMLADEDWIIRLQTLSTFTDVSLTLDSSLISSISENLSHDRWPVRMMTLYLLSSLDSKNFDAVLNWAAQYDTSPYVRQMAKALGASVPAAAPEGQTEQANP
ncbi:MAG TPA: hypothetical protein PKY88_05920 [Anaerohalosphaeraceae bacterium]|nr:hypothetical protein [Anaerohalosphaeraceae bacterium]